MSLRLTLGSVWQRTARRKPKLSAWSGVSLCFVLSALTPSGVHAQFSGSASANGQYESNSNVFYVTSGYVPPPNTEFHRSDTFFAYGAELDGDYLINRQQLYARLSGKEFNYRENTQLNHSDYSLDAGLLWKLGGPLDGKLDVRRTESMVPLYDLSGSTLALSRITEQRETAQVDVKLTSLWMLEGTGFTSKSEQPIPLAPNLELRQNSGAATLNYLGIGKLTAGLTVGYLSGEYSGSNGAVDPHFDQTNAGLVANYVHNRTSFQGNLGYTRRDSATGADNTSGITGAIILTQQLTPKTSIGLKADRMVNSYLLNAGSEIDSDVGATLTWQATYKLGVNLGYTFSYRDFPRQGNNPIGTNRIDIQESAIAGMIYRPFRWMTLAPYANFQTRRSTFVGGHYSSNVYGITFTVTPFRPKGRR